VSHLVFRDIVMTDVKNALIISEYYPKVIPPEDNAAQPVTRLTPHFHDIVLNNVRAKDSGTAGAIVGLPESPVRDVVLRNVEIGAHTGLIVGYANLTEEHVQIEAAQGQPITKMTGASVTQR
jgi:hypothetical protein